MNNWKIMMALGLMTASMACGGEELDTTDDPDGAGGAGGDAASSVSVVTSTTTTGGNTGGAAPGCEAASIDDFTPEWTPPQGIYQGVCDEQTIDTIADDCFGPLGTTPKCEAALALDPGCGACMVTGELEATHGAIVDYRDTRGFFDRNNHGCYAHAEGDLSENGCGAKVKAAMDCATTSCRGCFPVFDNEDIGLLNACASDALTGVCATYAAEAEACVAAQTGPIADLCPWGNEGFDELAKRYGRLFCGAEMNGGGN